MKNIKLLDCTLRDGVYYDAWDFPLDTTNDYLITIQGGDIVELCFRSIKIRGLRGPMPTLLVIFCKVYLFLTP